MIERPYKSLSLSILNSILNESQNNIEVLSLLEQELSSRRTAEAAILLQQTIKLLKKREQNDFDDSNPTITDDDYVKCPKCGCEPEFESNLIENHIFRCQNPECNFIFSVMKDDEDDICIGMHQVSSNLKGIICIDFGTSSIKVGLAENLDGLNPIPLKIGEFSDSEFDYELPTTILVSNDINPKVFFASEAYKIEMKHIGESIFYESSPKKWITHRDNYDLKKPLSAKTKINREDLLFIVFCHAINNIKLSLGYDLSDEINMEVRISHPVWPLHLWEKNKTIYENLLQLAIQHSNKIHQGVDEATLLNFSRQREPLIPNSNIDIDEPVAAAVQLFPNESNSRELCAIIDIGAGTTDFGLFLSLTPDNLLTEDYEPFRRKFIPLQSPISIPLAGDYIDEILINLYKNKIQPQNSWKKIFRDSSESEIDLKTFEINIRKNKVRLFEKDVIQQGSIQINKKELLSEPKIIKMADDIAKTLNNLIVNSADKIIEYWNLRTNYIREINLIFSGGGHQLTFIKDKIDTHISLKSSKNGSCINIPIVVKQIAETSTRISINQARLAVALGGTTSENEWPNSNINSQVIGRLDHGPW